MTETERAGAARRARIFDPSVARNPLAAVAGAVACFLVVFVLLAARAANNGNQALTTASTGQVVVKRVGHTILRTTASGRVISARGTTASEGRATAAAAIMPRASGAGGGSDE